jgi:hypothetical protein
VLAAPTKLFKTARKFQNVINPGFTRTTRFFSVGHPSYVILVEGNTWNDKFCGVCKKEVPNMLGELLMKLRTQYREQEQNA